MSAAAAEEEEVNDHISRGRLPPLGTDNSLNDETCQQR
jgi:hypothetical protein